ncbi:MAG: dTMP kinase [Gammaproteobacteria bacterium]
MSRGKFITLEGGEGGGKTTNLAFIKDFLENQRIPLLVTREPGGTPLAETLRQLLLEPHGETWTGESELLLMFAARSQHLRHVILPALTAGKWVLCDRFTDATYAYQGGGRHMERNHIVWLENLVQGCFRPDLTLLFDVSVDVGMKRIAVRGKPDRFEAEHREFFHNVRRAYIEQAELHADRFRIVNADQPLAEVQKNILDVLRRFIENAR